MTGSLVLMLLLPQLCGLAIMALASSVTNVSSSTVSGDTLDYCRRFIANVNPYQLPYWEGMNASLSSYCLSSWCSTLNQITPYTTVYEQPVYSPKFQPIVSTTTTGAGNLSTATITSTITGNLSTATITTTVKETPYTYISYSSYPSFSSPCCGECEITIKSGAQVLYWPTPAPQPPVSTVVDATGFTYISPSVYVVFSSLSAGDNCGTVGCFQQNYTTSFARDELSTLSSEIHGATLSTLPFNYADLSDCFTSFVTVTYSKLYDTTELFTTVEPDWQTPAAYDVWISKSYRCYPKIVVGTWMTELDPAWSTCTVASNYVGSGPIIYAQPLALGVVNSDSITTASSSMTTTSASPSATPESYAASTTSTTEASVTTDTSQAEAYQPVASSSQAAGKIRRRRQ